MKLAESTLLILVTLILAQCQFYVDRTADNKLSVAGLCQEYSINKTAPFLIHPYITVVRNPFEVNILQHEYSHLIFGIYKNAAESANKMPYPLLEEKLDSRFNEPP